MYIKSIFSFSIILFLFSCENNTKGVPLELDNGEKWTIIESMDVYIQAMEKDVVSFEKSIEKDYSGLAEKLTDNLGLLTANCTMKGKAHDELHKWLVPYIDQVKSLSKANDDGRGAEIFKQIQGSFVTYNQYFQ